MAYFLLSANFSAKNIEEKKEKQGATLNKTII